MRGRAEERTGTKAGGALGKKLAGRSSSGNKPCEVEGSSNSREEEVVEKGSNLHGGGQQSSNEEGALGGCSSSIREIKLKVQVTPMLRLLTDWGGGWEGKFKVGQRHGES
jgi:hypothetical protein